MTDYDIHSCGYYCNRPACIEAQRNELRDKLFSNQAVKTSSLYKMLEHQIKLHETAVDMLKPATEAAYQKGYNDAMGWKVENHLEHLPTNKEWVGLTDDEKLIIVFETDNPIDVLAATEAKLKEKNT